MTWTRTPLIWGEAHVSAETQAPSRFNLPAGTVTFLLSDIEGSTRLWSQFPDAMAAAVADTYAVLDRAVAQCDGVRPVEQGEGDSVVAAFERAQLMLHESLAIRAVHGASLYVPQVFDALAEVAAQLESYEESARVLGAARRARDQLGLERWAPDGPRLVALETTLREALGAETFEAAHDEGMELGLEDAVVWIRGAHGERKRPSRGWASLTPTELRVAGLVAEGLTNPEIGARMFISRGTVKVHVSHIFAKLGLASRAELAAEATRRAGPAP